MQVRFLVYYLQHLRQSLELPEFFKSYNWGIWNERASDYVAGEVYRAQVVDVGVAACLMADVGDSRDRCCHLLAFRKWLHIVEISSVESHLELLFRKRRRLVFLEHWHHF